MNLNRQEIENEINSLENQMSEVVFWENKEDSKIKVKRLQDLKESLNRLRSIDEGDAIMTIFSGAGGDDAEDFSKMLLEMYFSFGKKKGFVFSVLHENKNEKGGYRNITVEIVGKDAYKTFKNESGVHRLVRISPFNAKKLRHTSFSLVEVVPKIKRTQMQDLKESEIKIDFSKSSGPGGQNVNKRETAVRVVHLPTGITSYSSNARSQEANREKAMELLMGKLHRYYENKENNEMQSFYISKTTDIEWGNQIRSYVLHPYKMVKDHRTQVETSDIESVLSGEKLEEFLIKN